jgi:hypothetical protein|tara:strand:+ start:1825 stop:2169 length:345 start_codon:yes stop_codon:yes gene_type:complete
MTELEIILSTVTVFSIVLNICVFVYARSAISRLLYVSNELGDLKSMIDSFSNHTESVYQMEMFYGDQTLEDLMNHAQSFNQQLETFEFIYSLTDADAIEQEEIELGTKERTIEA